MEETGLQAVTRKLLEQVKAIVDEGSSGLSELKQAAAVLKDIRDLQKDIKDPGETGIRVVLEGELSRYGD